MSTGTHTGRHPVRRHQIVAAVRGEIVSGQLEPGSRLPGRMGLQRRFGTGTITVREAIAALHRDGFLTTDSTRGTFVAHHPPHLCQYALVFPFRQSSEQSRFFVALEEAAGHVDQQPARRICAHWGISPGGSSRRLAGLVQDVVNERVAGLIFTTPPFGLDETPLLQKPGMPRVVIQAHGKTWDMPAVKPDMEEWMRRAVTRAAQMGARSVGMLAGSADVEWWNETLQQACATVGVQTRRHWAQFAAHTAGSAVTHLVELWARSDDRPDALLIGDDNLVDAALEGLRRAEVRPGQDLRIIAHANFPLPGLVDPRITLLGFDVCDLLHTCVQLIQQQRRRHPVPSETRVRPLFADELSDATQGPCASPRGRSGGGENASNR